MSQSTDSQVHYRDERKITASEFVDLLNRSTLGQRRPVEDLDRIQAMLDHANLLCTAWVGDLLVGVARSLTDFSYCCYLSDLAVDRQFQKQGIGRELIANTRRRLHPDAKVILLAAPAAVDYYPHIGFSRHESAWMMQAGDLEAG